MPVDERSEFSVLEELQLLSRCAASLRACRRVSAPVVRASALHRALRVVSGIFRPETPLVMCNEGSNDA